MQFIISQPSANRPATHKSPLGPLVNVVQVADTVKVHSLNPVLATFTGSPALTMTTTTTTTTTTKLASDNSDALVTAQTAAVAKVTNTYNATVAKGVTLPNPVGKGTITLPADRTSKHELTSLAAHLINSQAPATSGVSIDDINGNLITMTVAQFQTLMVAYGTACLTAWTAYRQQVSQINAATDIPTITLIAS